MTEGQGTGGGLWNLSALVAGTTPQPPAGPPVTAPVAEDPVGEERVAQESDRLVPPVVPASSQQVPVLPIALFTPPPTEPPPPQASPIPAPQPPFPPRLRRIRLTTRTIVALAVASVFVVAASGATVTVLNRGEGSTPPAPAAPPVAVTTAATSVGDGALPTPTPSPPPSPGPSPTVDGQAAALKELQQLRDADIGTVPLERQYVAQLASKSAGIVDQHQVAADGTHTFQATDILAEHLRLRKADSLDTRIVLLLSTDYGRRQLYQGQPLWVTFALGDFGSAAAVQQWCARRFPGLSGALLADYCTPRRLEPVGG